MLNSRAQPYRLVDYRYLTFARFTPRWPRECG